MRQLDLHFQRPDLRQPALRDIQEWTLDPVSGQPEAGRECLRCSGEVACPLGREAKGEFLSSFDRRHTRI